MSELHLPNRIRQSASTRPFDPAITCGDRTLTCADLDAETNALASALVGVATDGARVGALLRMGLEGAEVFIACAKAGAVFIPLNWRLSPRELVDIAEDAELDVLIVDDEFAVGGSRDCRSVIGGDGCCRGTSRGRDRFANLGGVCGVRDGHRPRTGARSGHRGSAAVHVRDHRTTQRRRRHGICTTNPWGSRCTNSVRMQWLWTHFPSFTSLVQAG